MSGDFERVDVELYRDFSRLISGADAHHALAPDELAMLHEEGGEAHSGRDKLREEIFTAVCEHVLAEGPHPARMKERIEGIMRQYNRAVLQRMRTFVRWWDAAALDAVLARHEQALRLRPRGRRVAFVEALSGKVAEEADGEFVKECFKKLCGLWVSEGHDWKHVVSCHMVVVKALRPELLITVLPDVADSVRMMSLEDLAVICGDKGKATVSARGKRLLNQRIERAGGHGCYAHYQKSASAVARYRAAQMGNHNRREGCRKKDEG